MSSHLPRFLAFSCIVPLVSFAEAQTRAPAPIGLDAADGEAVTLLLGTLAQQAYVKAANAGAGDNFGTSVSMSGDTLVVGAPAEASRAAGVNGDGTDDGAQLSGAAYVLVRSGTVWTQQAYLKASNSEAGDEFGYSVCVSGDTIVVGAKSEDGGAAGVNGDELDNGAPFSGAAYVFVRSGTTWTQQAYLKASSPGAGDGFGATVCVSGDTIVVGAGGEDSSATGVNGDATDDGAPNSGAAYVFVRNGTSWSQQAYLKASNTDPGDGFGGSISLSGDTVLIGAGGEDSPSTGVNGGQGNVGGEDSGAAYVFVRSGTSWTQQAYLKASNAESRDLFGVVSVSGDTAVVGASFEDSGATDVNGAQADNGTLNSGAAYVFVRNGTVWSQEAYLKASNTDPNDHFGGPVSLSGDRVVIGAFREDCDSTGVNGAQDNDLAMFSGAAYVFSRDGTTWSQEAYLKASNTETQDFFGFSVAASGDAVVVGAIGEDSSASVVNGHQGGGAEFSGACYVYSASSAIGFCDASDGALAACPCASAGHPDSGCENAQATGGVRLDLLAQTTSPNGATLLGSGFPTTGTPTAVVIRSNALDAAGPVAFGDGLRCVGSTSLVLLAATTSSAGTSMHAIGHDAAAGPGAFHYQVWYRNQPTGFCTPAGFNLSSGRTLVW